MTKQTRNSPRLRSVALAIATAVSLAVLAPSIGIAAETVQPKVAKPVNGQTSSNNQTTSSLDTPVNSQTPTNTRSPSGSQSTTSGQSQAYGLTPTNGQTTTNRQTPTNGQASTYGQTPTSSQSTTNRPSQTSGQTSGNGLANRDSLNERVTPSTSQNATTGVMSMPGMSRTGNVDQDFAANLRMHHGMGVALAQAQIKDGRDPEMKRVAQKFVDAQQADIIVLDRWLASNKMPDAE